MNFIAVLLTCHNRKEKTLLCLSALYKCILQEKYAFEVFLADDGSTDGTVQVVREEFPQVNIIQGDGNLYWNRGMHKAWKTAAETKDYDYYLWLNDDTILFSYALQELLECSISENDGKIICGSTCSTSNRETITYGGRTKGKLMSPTGEKQTCENFNGNIVLIPRYVYHNLGLNDPVFHHSWGDLDYGLRAGKLGIDSIVAPLFSGLCDRDRQIPEYVNPNISLFQRFKKLYSPRGNNPHEVFIYVKRHDGLLKAIKLYISVHWKALFPYLGKY
jgi:GT2 family glycosyltransferase